MIAYCARRLCYLRSAGEKSVQVARVAYEYPVLFEMLADGHMSLTALLTSSPP